MYRYLYVYLCIAASAWAQETINYASLSGRVVDPAGAVILGATVTARQTETNQSTDAETDRDGRFRFAYLRVGPYEVSVRKQGFADTLHKVQLTVGAAFDLPFTLVGRKRPDQSPGQRRGAGD